MNHKWKENKDFIPKDGYYKQLVCIRCGLVQTHGVTKFNGRPYGFNMNERSGLIYGTDMPECIDWNDNTLD